MFEQILALVKDHIGNDPQIAQHIPTEQAAALPGLLQRLTAHR